MKLSTRPGPAGLPAAVFLAAVSWAAVARGQCLEPELVTDVNSRTASSDPGSFAVLGARLIFVADDGLTGKELWRSDGTEAGTVRLKDIRPGSATSFPSELTTINGTLFFTADDG